MGAVAGGTGEDPGEGGVTEGTPRKGLLLGRGCGRHAEGPNGLRVEVGAFFPTRTHALPCLPQDGGQLGAGA